ncbi:hypothetical protein QVD17_20908 [Tagetes erecta]|uniref:Uncharacterized protein n=1 Tax=Tagetes erecta TaxID=13708 RepID=A0AAD8NYI1_TARER|nr:hypothetical protein QVD17_20908 [Tagetes erecta]
MFQPVLSSIFATSPSNPSSPRHHSHPLLHSTAQIIIHNKLICNQRYVSSSRHFLPKTTREKAKDFLEREKGAIYRQKRRKGFVFLISLSLDLISSIYSPIHSPIRVLILSLLPYLIPSTDLFIWMALSMQ